MVEVKVGDVFCRYHEGHVMSIKNVIRVSDKSIWLKNNSSNEVFRVKNTGAEGYWLPLTKEFKTKQYYRLKQN